MSRAAPLSSITCNVAPADSRSDRTADATSFDPELMAAAELLYRNRLPEAERRLKGYLKQSPTDVLAIRMLAELAGRLGRYEDSEKLLRRCLELAPDFAAAQQNYAFVLQKQNKVEEALSVVNRLLRRGPDDPGMRILKAATLVRIGEYAEASELYAGVLRQYPAEAKLWLSYGHTLKTLNRREAGIAAYRRSIELSPSLGEAYWSLANLKTFCFDVADIAVMKRLLAQTTLSDQDRLHLEFALGKALEDHGDYSGSFQHYQAGNQIRRRQIPYDADAHSRWIDRAIKALGPSFLSCRGGCGSRATDPIFVVGLPRSGSTLIEQILASHSAVEGTMELPDLPAMVKALRGRPSRGNPASYLEVLAELDPSQFAQLGEEYLRRTRLQRKTAKPYFIDKQPNNYLHVGLIQLMFPNARIIDARRHPMATCFSAYKQHFAFGQAFSYDLAALGRYYGDYVRLMRHVDAVLPGRVHRVYYEQMVEDSEREIRRLLEYCGLDFEPACLTFWQTERSVRTASSEQVRQPIFTGSVEHWRHFERWLEPLKVALGDAVERYPSFKP
ncbi:MAG: tetratricopeptide repeat-containing sulfotransferase family protein [Steroidobacteraceae bacterium]